MFTCFCKSIMKHNINRFTSFCYYFIKKQWTMCVSCTVYIRTYKFNISCFSSIYHGISTACWLTFHTHTSITIHWKQIIFFYFIPGCCCLFLNCWRKNLPAVDKKGTQSSQSISISYNTYVYFIIYHKYEQELLTNAGTGYIVHVRMITVQY